MVFRKVSISTISTISIISIISTNVLVQLVSRKVSTVSTVSTISISSIIKQGTQTGLLGEKEGLVLLVQLVLRKVLLVLLVYN